jgi:hypothetical protein
MWAKLITVIYWVFYGCLIYTAFNPAHEYLQYLDNARTLYIIVGIPSNILITVLVLVFWVMSLNDYKSLKEQMQTMDEDGKAKHIERLGSENIERLSFWICCNRVLSAATLAAVFVVLGDILLGSIMLYSFVGSIIAIGQLQKISKEALSVIK